MYRCAVFPCWIATLALVVGCDAGHSASDALSESGVDLDPVEPTGCEVADAPPSAPGGYYVSGNTICSATGERHVFHGVNRPGLEYSRGGDHLSARDFRLIASWGANVVRMGLNQDFWLAGSPLFTPSYVETVDSAVAWAKAAGLDVILDLHWSDRGVLGGCATTSCQQKMADDNSVTFWSEVAARYRDDGRVIFELYNEPHDISWQVWKEGGTVDGFHAAGMQQLYDTVRAAGAENLVIIGGLDWAYDLSRVPENRINGHNIAYATHPYDTAQRQPASWRRAWGELAATDPVIMTEFGNLNDPSCNTDYPSKVIEYADARGAGWTAWAWFPGGCTYPALIDDWSGAPSALGEVVQAALLGYGGPHPSVEPEEETPIHFTFDDTSEGWALNDYRDPDFTNLSVESPLGPPATLTHTDTDGDPTSGALELNVTISGTNQYVVAQTQLARSLAGKTLNARVRLKSGTLNGARVALWVCTGQNFVCAEGPPADLESAPGEWVTLQWDLDTETKPDFDLTKAVLLGIQVDTGFSVDGTAESLPDSGGGTLQIDTVTE